MYLEISNPMDYHVGLYIRLSKEDENEGPSESVTNQRSLLNEFIKKNRLSVYDVYIDDGWSGTNFDRPEFNRMIADIEAKKVNMVITKDLSRLGRDYIMTGHYMERYFPEKQVRYISLLDGIDTGIDSTANDITPFRAIMNDMYAKDISKKIKSVKHDKQRKGLFIGGKPLYGYKMHPSEKNKIVIDEEAAQNVRRIFSMALDGKSCRQIAVTLNEEHLPTPAQYAGLTISNPGPYSGRWSSERISEMLQNETYIGNMVQGRSVKVSYKSDKMIKIPREDWIIVENTHEPIIDKDVFQKVKALINSRKRTRSRIYDYLLKGMVFCHECGYPLAIINRKNAAGEDVLYFVCRTYQRFTKSSVCTCHNIKVERVTEIVLSKIQEVCEKYINRDEMMSIAKCAIKEANEADNCKNEINALQNRINKLTSDLDKIYSDKLNGLLSELDFERIYTQFKNEREGILRKIDDLRSNMKNNISVSERAKELVNKYINSAKQSRELLVSLVERVELTTDKQIIVKFRFKNLEEML